MTKKKTNSLALKVTAALLLMAGLLVVYILIGSIDGPMPQDDDLYAPPPADVPDEQNVRVALEGIVGYDYFGEYAKEKARASSSLIDKISQQSPKFGPNSTILVIYAGVDLAEYDFNDNDFEDARDIEFPYSFQRGNEVLVASNRFEFLALVDAALATNECLAAAFERAVDLPCYVEAPSLDMETVDFNQYFLYEQARHMRFIETKRYDEAIKNAHALLKLAHKIIHGYSAMTSSFHALKIRRDAIRHLATIASLKDSNEKTLAEIDAVLAHYDIQDWKMFCRKMLCEEYSTRKICCSDYSSLSLLDRHKAMRDIPVPFFLVDYLFHPNRTLTLMAEDIRRCLAALDDYNSLGTNRRPRGQWTMLLTPNALGRLYDRDSTLAMYCKYIADSLRAQRAYRLLIACRRHFLLTSKLPETAASVSHDLLPEPVLDPVFNIPYEIRTWRDGDKMYVGAFTKGGPEEAASGESGQPDSPKDKSISYLSWPIDEVRSDKSVSLSGDK